MNYVQEQLIIQFSAQNGVLFSFFKLGILNFLSNSGLMNSLIVQMRYSLIVLKTTCLKIILLRFAIIPANFNTKRWKSFRYFLFKQFKANASFYKLADDVFSSFWVHVDFACAHL